MRCVGEVAEARHAGRQRVVRCGETKIGAVDDIWLLYKYDSDDDLTKLKI